MAGYASRYVCARTQPMLHGEFGTEKPQNFFGMKAEKHTV